jgi:hypothetical protein
MVHRGTGGVLRRERAKRLRFYKFVNVSPKGILALSEPVPWRPAFKTLLAMATRAGEHTRQRVRPCETNMRAR